MTCSVARENTQILKEYFHIRVRIEAMGQTDDCRMHRGVVDSVAFVRRTVGEQQGHAGKMAVVERTPAVSRL